jgi:hypothetical protein
MLAVLACLFIGAIIGTLAIIADVAAKKTKKKAKKAVKLLVNKRKKSNRRKSA